MKQFGSLAAFAAEIPALEDGVVLELERGLEAVAAMIEKTAKDEIGEYQEAVGPFPAWEELADSTKADRVSKGYTENDPLLRSGALRDSISHQTKGLEAVIGSDSDIAVYQELGTSKIPPRPFLGPAVERNHEAIKKIVGGAVVKGLLGGGSIPSSLEYDHEI
jgi:HK97 gp10 family phage protein